VGRTPVILRPVQGEEVQEVLVVQVQGEQEVQVWAGAVADHYTLEEVGMEEEVGMKEEVGMEEEDPVSAELGELKVRAHRLSEQLALLSSTTTELLGSSHVEADNLPGMDVVPPEDASPPPSPTKRSKKTITFLLPDVPANDAEPSDDTETPKVVLDVDNAEEDEDVPSTDEAPRRTGSSWRHRQREVYAYPDLQAPPSYRYRLPGGRYFWQMPFRHTLYQQLAEPKAQETSDSEGEEGEEVAPAPPPPRQELDPRVFAPTGDIYSYFCRRVVAPHQYTAPTHCDARRRLGGRGPAHVVF